MIKDNTMLIGLVDADMLANGTRHPNLALLKIAGYLRDNKQKYELICDADADISKYDYIYLSRVFTFTPLPKFYLEYQKSLKDGEPDKFRCGGTGFYATEEDNDRFMEDRLHDFHRLDNDPLLPGLDMRTQMPDYDLYKAFVESQIAKGRSRVYYKDYLDYSR